MMKTTTLRNSALAGLIGLASTTAGAAAGYVTINESLMDSIFSQTSFGALSIDIRFNAPLSFNRPELTVFDEITEWGQLAAMSTGRPTVNMFFVDRLTSCGSQGSFVGCATVGGNVMVLNSFWAADATRGGVLAAHELAHNLGLSHVTTAGNLMTSSLTSASQLTSAQVTGILSSNLVQLDGNGQRYITITPIALVPEPGAWLLMGLGLGLLLVQRQRQARALDADPVDGRDHQAV